MRTALKSTAVLVVSLFFLASAGKALTSAPADKGLTGNDKKPGQGWMKDMNLVLVKGGCYQMGDTFDEGATDEQPAHEVCVGDFIIGKFEVTQAEWQKVMGNNPSSFKGCDTCPVERVRWDEVQEFLSKLNQPAGNNFNQQSRKKYRLPTEAEWEYAARSGGKNEKWAGTSSEPELGEYAWCSVNSGDRTHPVGQKKPNGLGIYDMSGNVWEWVEDLYSKSAYLSHGKNSGISNEFIANIGAGRVYRGGGWQSQPGGVRAAYRNHNISTVSRHDDLGFRIARNP